MLDRNSPTPPTAHGSGFARTGWLASALLALLTLLMLGAELVTPRPLETHEVFVAQTSREMLAANEWVLPSFNAEPRLNKPPLAYWLVMVLESLSPSDPPVPEWKARLPSALSAAVLVVCTFWIGAALYPARTGRVRTGLLAGMLILGSSGVFRYGTNARPEMLYAACCALMMVGLVRGWMSADRSRSQAWWAALVWVGFGLAVLAKGPHVPLMLLGGAALFAWSEGRAARLWQTLRPWWGVALMLAIAVPWVLLVWLRAPQAGAVWFEQLSDAPDRGEHSWAEYFSPYYVWGLPQILLPWVVLLPFGLASCFVRSPENLRRGRMLLWVFGVVFVVMSVSTHRRGYYMLPMLAALGPLMAAGTLDALGKVRGRAAAWLHSALWGGAVLVVVVFAWLGTQQWVWGKGGALKDAFARQVAAHAGTAPVYLIGERAGIITYRVGRPTPVLDSPAELVDRIGTSAGGEVWAVMPPKSLSAVPASLRTEVIAEQDTGQKDEALVLVRVRSVVRQ
ncbi:MAG: ArnT family glycosyltransferase [Phycisphaerales bacterium]